MVLKYFTDGDFRFHSYILKEKVRQCKEKVQTLTESHDLHQSGVATFFMGPSLGPSQQYLQNSSLIFIITRHIIFRIW